MANLRAFIYSIAAGSFTEANVVGRMISVLEASAAFKLSWDNNAPIPADRGLKFVTDYNYLKLENSSGSTITVTLLLGDGDIQDYRTNVRPQIASKAFLLWNAAVDGTLVVGNESFIQASNPNRVEALFQSPIANTADIIIKGATGSTSRLWTLKPGDSFRVNYTGPIYANSASVGQVLLANATEY